MNLLRAWLWLHWRRLLDRLRAENEALRIALNPRRWTRAQSDAWHRALPDVHAAFEALRNVTPNAEVTGRGPKETG